MLRLAGAKPVLIQEIGCATHESIDSSPELQAQFIEQLVAWLPGKEDRILGISWLSHIDWPYAHTKQALQGFLDEQLLKHEPFLRYRTSLGLMYEDGTRKPGYDTLKNSLALYRRGELRPMPLSRPRQRAVGLSNAGFEAGDEDAFGGLVDRYDPRPRSSLSKLLGEVDWAENVRRDVWLAVILLRPAR